MPKRIQRKRRSGWKAPAGAAYVGRGTRWGNPWRVVPSNGCSVGLEVRSQWRNGPHWDVVGPDGESWCYEDVEGAFKRAAELYVLAMGSGSEGVPSVQEVRSELVGRDLMCWCRPGLACHADALLEVANG